MSLDIKAAYEYLKSQEIYEISIIGASIGANAAINFAAEEKSLKSLILLSPGIEYRGIKTERAIRKYYGPLLILVGKNDKYSYDSSERLFKISPSSSKLESYETSNHGTELILKTAGVKELIKDWLGNN